ncbi:MAG: aminopeptidase [Candidatus Hydrothermarchaeota archaeon]|mgnify:FL=1
MLARKILSECMGLRKGERVLVVSDEAHRVLAEDLEREAGSMGSGEVFWLEDRPVEALPKSLAARLEGADIVLTPIDDHEEEFPFRSALIEMATKRGRIGHMLGITEDDYPAIAGADYLPMAERTDRVAEILARARRAEVHGRAGTALTMELGGWQRLSASSTGLLHERGAFGNLPAGEAAIAPLEGTTEGRIVFDRNIANVGLLHEPVEVDVKGGRVQGIEGGEEAERLRFILERAPKGDNIAELGIGTNDTASLQGSILVEEKALGTIHIGLGDNSHLGGTVEAGVHLDGIILEPTVIIDGRTLLDGGVLRLEEFGGEDYSQLQPTYNNYMEKLEACPSTPLKKVWRCHAGRHHETSVGDERTARLAGEVWGAFEARAGLGEIAIKIGRPEGEVRKIARVMEAYEIARTY